jgi:uncharacterized protein (TIGR03437 family)
MEYIDRIHKTAIRLWDKPPACLGTHVKLPLPRDGALWPLKPLANRTLRVSVQINYVDAEVTYSGSTPGLISGVFQINVKVPDLFSPPPTVPIVITANGSPSPPAFIAVK